MSGVFQTGDSVFRSAGGESGKITKVYGDEANPMCDVSYGDGSVENAVPMSELNAG